MHWVLKHLTPFLLLVGSPFAHGSVVPNQHASVPSATSKTKVLILGGGMAGVIAARTLHEQGIDDFVLLEARDELGGRLYSTPFGGHVIEVGANWIHGTRSGDGPINPILELANKHGLRTHVSDSYGSLKTFDEAGEVDYLELYNAGINNFDEYVNYTGTRLSRNLVDLTARSAYDYIGKRPRNAREMAVEYMNVGNLILEYPFSDRWRLVVRLGICSDSTAVIWNCYCAEAGGFSDDNILSIDQRGYKTIIQHEAMTFLKRKQLRLNALVKVVEWSASGVKAVLGDGSSISADYAICTFSLGVLKNEDVKFQPDFPGTPPPSLAQSTLNNHVPRFQARSYSKHDDGNLYEDISPVPREVLFGLYADSERGRYPVWQSLDKEGFMPGSGIIFVTVTGDYSERIEAMSDEEVKAEAMDVLRTMYPNSTIPEPLDFKFHRWYNDPLYRGSFSNWPPSFVRQHHDNFRANVERLYFAGEATSQNYYGPSSLEARQV
ncbi:hypothetical protein C0992_007049 [Termitomyces sp. T32_za158]|nr:hypothetical protein C0992_007049 [Termitomyces sp. T32_za158]